VPLRFTFDGAEYTGYRGDTLASALIANGVRTVAPSLYRRRPRGIVAAGADEPNALVRLAGPCSESMLLATTIELYDGLSAVSLSGTGRLDDRPDPHVYDKKHVHADVLVVGGGPAGLAAALAAGGSDARVLLVDDQPELGGTLLSQPPPEAQPPSEPPHIDGQPALGWVAACRARLAALPEVNVLRRATALGYYDHNFVVIAERRTDHLGPEPLPGVSRQRLWHVRARQVVLATGAHERPLIFAGNDRPGVMLASAVRTYVNRYAVLPGRNAVVFTTNDDAYRTAFDLIAAGASVAAVVDTRPDPPAALLGRARAVGIEVIAGAVVAGTLAGSAAGSPASSGAAPGGPVSGGAAPGGAVSGGAASSGPASSGTGPGGADQVGWVSGVLVSAIDEDGLLTGPVREIGCDLLAVSGGWSPVVHLFSQSGGSVRYDDELAAFVPGRSAQAERSAGAARGILSLAECLADGFTAGTEAASAAASRSPAPSRSPAAAGGAAPSGGASMPHPCAYSSVAAASMRTAPGTAAEDPAGAPRPVWVVPGIDGGPADWDTHFVDLQRDSTVADVYRASGAGLRSAEHIKRYTTIGTAHDQGKTSGVAAIGVIAHALGGPVDRVPAGPAERGRPAGDVPQPGGDAPGLRHDGMGVRDERAAWGAAGPGGVEGEQRAGPPDADPRESAGRGEPPGTADGRTGISPAPAGNPAVLSLRRLEPGAPGGIGTTTFRPPYVPVCFALLAGRERGGLFGRAPIRGPART
jgi:sarcosine oxidase subunit alpha